jgi:hypothetical protein
MDTLVTSLSIIADIPINTHIRNDISHAISNVLKWATCFFYFHGKLENGETMPLALSENSAIRKNSSSSDKESVDKHLDFMLDGKLCLSVISMIRKWGRYDTDIAMYSYIVLLAGVTCVKGFGLLLISMDGFWDIFVSDTMLSPSDGVRNYRKEYSRKILSAECVMQSYRIKILLNITSDVMQASNDGDSITMKPDSVWPTSTSLRWNVLFDVLSFISVACHIRTVHYSTACPDSGQTNIRTTGDPTSLSLFVDIGFGQSLTIESCISSLESIIPSNSTSHRNGEFIYLYGISYGVDAI